MSSEEIPSIAIYMGEGASHSWIWFVDTLERAGQIDLRFLDEKDLKDGGLQSCHVLLLSGGDTFKIAGALDSSGSEALSDFISRGGTYIGSCAGAYLPMFSSKSPLNLFNFVRVKIANLTVTLPSALRLKHKYSTQYGCQYVFHPVREEVRMKMAENLGGAELLAPLYGGPAMIPTDEVEVLATYNGFTPRTLFLTDEEVARGTYLDRVAAVRGTMGDGELYLFGPHFEHPDYEDANSYLLQIIRSARRDTLPCSAYTGESEDELERIDLSLLLRTFRGRISDLRVRYAGFENMNVLWNIGHKVYEPEKVGAFLHTIWSRLSHLSSLSGSAYDKDRLEACIDMAKKVNESMRAIRKGVQADEDQGSAFEQMFTMLKQMTRNFFEIYFRCRPGNCDLHPRAVQDDRSTDKESKNNLQNVL